MRLRPAVALTPDMIAAIAEQVRVRLLRWYAPSGLIASDDGCSSWISYPSKLQVIADSGYQGSTGLVWRDLASGYTLDTPMDRCPLPEFGHRPWRVGHWRLAEQMPRPRQGW